MPFGSGGGQPADADKVHLVIRVAEAGNADRASACRCMDEAVATEVDTDVGKLCLILEKDQVAGACLGEWNLSRAAVLVERGPRNLESVAAVREPDQPAAIEAFRRFAAVQIRAAD